MKSILSLIAMVLLCGNAAADYKVPNQSYTESIFGGTGDRGKAEAYADAMQLAKPARDDDMTSAVKNSSGNSAQ